MAIVHVANSSSIANDVTAGTFPSYSITLSGAAPNGATFCVMVGAINLAGLTVSDNATGGSNTYNPVDQSGDSNYTIATYYATGLHGAPTTITASFTGGQFPAIAVDCFTGVASTTALDGHNIRNQTTVAMVTDTVTASTFTPSTGGDLIWGATAQTNNVVTIGTGTSFVTGQSVASTFKTEYKLAGVAGSQSTTFTPGGATSATWITGGLALKAATTSGPCIFGTQSLLGAGCFIWGAKKLAENPVLTRRGVILSIKKA